MPGPDHKAQRINSITGMLVFLIVAICPLMIGGNRPVFWMLNAVVIFATAAFYFSCIALGLVKPRYALSRTGLLGGLICVYLAGVSLHTLSGFFNISGLPKLSGPDNAALGLLRLWSYAMLFYLTLQVARNHERAERMARALFWVFAGYTLYGLAAWRDPGLYLYAKVNYIGYITGPFINRNSFATFLAFGLVFTLSHALSGFRGQERNTPADSRGGRAEHALVTPLYLAIILLTSAAILGTGSRMGAAAALIGSATVVLLHWRSLPVTVMPRRRRVLWTASTLLALSFLLLVAALYGGQTFERLAATEDSADVRWALYRNVWQMVMAQPLWGVGIDNFQQGFQTFHRLPVSPDLHWDHAHNTYLSLWAELGLILGSLPPVICAIAAGFLIRPALSRRNRGPLSRAALGMIAISGVHSLVDFPLEIEANVFILIFVIAMALAAEDKIERTGKAAGRGTAP